MNDPDFERNLRYLLRPAEPTEELRQRIQDDLGASESEPPVLATRLPASTGPGFLYRLLRDFGWACAGAAAVVAVLAAVPGKHWPIPVAKQDVAANQSAVAADSAATFEHDETTHELVSTENSDQLVETDDGPAREVRYSYLERHAWSNPRTGARVVLEVPREDVYLLPVSLE